MIAARPSLRTFLEIHYRQARPDLKPDSIEQIELAIDMLELWAKQEVFCDQLSREFLLAFRAWRLEERPLPACKKHGYPMRKVRGCTWRCPQPGCANRTQHAPKVSHATANKSVRTIMALWREAIDQGWNQGPMKRIRPLKEDLDNLACWDQADLAAILASCKQEPQELFLPCPTDLFWFALILLIYDTGSRISAIMNATPADLDWQNATLTLRAKTTKGRKCQVFGLPAETLEALKAVYDPARAYIFPWPYGRGNNDWRSLRNRYKRILKRAGLACGKKDLFHKIRRTTATELTIASGIAAAKEHLGHSAESVTKRYIDRRRLDSTQRNARLLPRPKLD